MWNENSFFFSVNLIWIPTWKVNVTRFLGHYLAAPPLSSPHLWDGCWAVSKVAQWVKTLVEQAQGPVFHHTIHIYVEGETCLLHEVALWSSHAGMVCKWPPITIDTDIPKDWCKNFSLFHRTLKHFQIFCRTLKHGIVMLRAGLAQRWEPRATALHWIWEQPQVLTRYRNLLSWFQFSMPQLLIYKAERLIMTSCSFKD